MPSAIGHHVSVSRSDGPSTPGHLKFRGMSGLFWYYFVIMLGLTAMAVALLIAGALQQDGTAPFVTGLILTVFAVPSLVFMFSGTMRPVVLTENELRIPGVFGTTAIPLAELAGIGLLYQRTPNTRAPEGWFLEVWGKDGKNRRVGRFLVAALRMPKPPPGQKRPFISFGRDPSLPLPHEDVQDLAHTRPGRIAKQMYDWVLARQGPSGPLATRALQKTVTFDRWAATETWAWWSPDGTMGRLRT